MTSDQHPKTFFAAKCLRHGFSKTKARGAAEYQEGCARGKTEAHDRTFTEKDASRSRKASGESGKAKTELIYRAESVDPNTNSLAIRRSVALPLFPIVAVRKISINDLLAFRRAGFVQLCHRILLGLHLCFPATGHVLIFVRFIRAARNGHVTGRIR
jgi:hypothetical protein